MFGLLTTERYNHRMYHQLTRLIAGATFLALACQGLPQAPIGRSAAGEKAARERATVVLAGLREVQVGVLYEMPQPGGQGIAGELQTSLEAKLKKAGAVLPTSRVVPDDEPMLEIRIGLNAVGSLMNIEASIYEPVTIVRNGKKVRGVSLHDEWLYTFDKRDDRPENNPHTQAKKAFEEVADWLVARYGEANR